MINVSFFVCNVGYSFPILLMSVNSSLYLFNSIESVNLFISTMPLSTLETSLVSEVSVLSGMLLALFDIGIGSYEITAYFRMWYSYSL
jgi:hypothetical protein